MYIHREGKATIILVLIFLLMVNVAVHFLLPHLWFVILLGISVLFFIFILSFFRNPNRVLKPLNNGDINCPADGKIVVIEEVFEKEYFKEKKKLVSIFMSPLNVHVNRNPVSGKINYAKYHPGTYLAAWHPKASEENERTTIVYESNGKEILMRQIAGALARRIMYYVKEGQAVSAGEEMGFIKFGSRVDLYLPLESKIHVNMDQVVKGNIDIIATL